MQIMCTRKKKASNEKELRNFYIQLFCNLLLLKDIMARKTIYTDDAPEPIGPYSQAISINGMLFVSGQIPLDPFSGVMIRDGIKEETTQVMENLKAILHAAEMDFSNVVKCSIFLTDMQDFPKVNEVYGNYFKSNPPARETVEVSVLPENANVEISCIAVR